MVSDETAIRSLLWQVSRPGRYAGGQPNPARLNPSKGDLRICMCFPDVHEVGICHTGFRLLHQAFNRAPGVVCERAFAPWPDMADRLKAAGIRLFSLETRTPLDRFDLLGFTISYELALTNMLLMLDLAGVPLLAADRDGRHPLVIAGGACGANPEPQAEIADAIFIGEADSAAAEMARALTGTLGLPRHSRLQALAGVSGVYVPALSSSHSRPRRRIEPDLDRVPGEAGGTVPLVRPVHDRLVVEIQRGCTRGCRFCQAGSYYRPVRQRSPEEVLERLLPALAASGNDGVSLLSLSAGDYHGLAGLLERAAALLEPERVSLSLPSLRVETLTEAVARIIASTRKTGFTIAPEAATDRLRAAINKRNTEEELFRTVAAVFRHGWRQVKLYFMLGLPGETEGDVMAIPDLLSRLVRESVRGGGRGLSVSLSPFVPKPWTPFQWEAALPVDELKQRLAAVTGALRGNRRVEVRRHDLRLSWLEAVLSRGDRSVGRACIAAYRAGARFDGWDELHRVEPWLKGFAEAGVDPERFRSRLDPGADLPWESVDLGIELAFLEREKLRAERCEETPDCLGGDCQACGVCSGGIEPRQAPEGAAPAIATGATQASATVGDVEDRPYVYRLKHLLDEPFVWAGHLDVTRALAMGLRRSRLPLRYTGGFHPRPLLSFGPALPLGIASRCEYADLELERRLDARAVFEALAAVMPSGLDPLEACDITDVRQTIGSIEGDVESIGYEVRRADGGTLDPLAGRLADFMARDVWTAEVARGGGMRTVELRGRVFSAAIEDGALLIRCGLVSPIDLAWAMLGLPAGELRLTKTATWFRRYRSEA